MSAKEHIADLIIELKPNKSNPADPFHYDLVKNRFGSLVKKLSLRMIELMLEDIQDRHKDEELLILWRHPR